MSGFGSTGRWLGAALAALLAVGLAASQSPALGADAIITYVSKNAHFDGGNAASYGGVVADGSGAVVFQSTASNFPQVADGGGGLDLFMDTSPPEQLNVLTDGTRVSLPEGDDITTSPVSDDGRFVAFWGASPEGIGAYLRDRATSQTRYLRNGVHPSMSGDGELTAFLEGSLDPPRWHLRLHHRSNNLTTSVASDARSLAESPLPPHISGDGKWIVYSTKTPFVASDTNGEYDAYLWDLQAGSWRLVSSRLGGGGAGNGRSIAMAISHDGRWILFDSGASNLVPGDVAGTYDAFLFDRTTGAIERVNLSDSGAPTTGLLSSGGDVSDDGRYVSFSNGTTQLNVYRRDRFAKRTEQVSVFFAWSSGTGGSMNGRGTRTAFTSNQPYDPSSDFNGVDDVYYGELPQERLATSLVAQPVVLGTSPLQAPLNVGAQLKRGDGTPLVGYDVRFTYGPNLLCMGRTDVNGNAGCGAPSTGMLLAVLGTLGYDATFAGDANFLGSSAHAGLIHIGATKLF